MKKLSALMLGTVAALTLTGCDFIHGLIGGGDDDKGGDSNALTSEKIKNSFYEFANNGGIYMERDTGGVYKYKVGATSEWLYAGGGYTQTVYNIKTDKVVKYDINGSTASIDNTYNKNKKDTLDEFFSNATFGFALDGAVDSIKEENKIETKDYCGVACSVYKKVVTNESSRSTFEYTVENATGFTLATSTIIVLLDGSMDPISTSFKTNEFKRSWSFDDSILGQYASK